MCVLLELFINAPKLQMEVAELDVERDLCGLGRPPVFLIIGCRQAGKTTLVKSLIERTLPESQHTVVVDPRGRVSRERGCCWSERCSGSEHFDEFDDLPDDRVRTSDIVVLDDVFVSGSQGSRVAQLVEDPNRKAAMIVVEQANPCIRVQPENVDAVFLTRSNVINVRKRIFQRYIKGVGFEAFCRALDDVMDLGPWAVLVVLSGGTELRWCDTRLLCEKKVRHVTPELNPWPPME